MSLGSQLQSAQQDFIEIVWPAISDLCGGGDIIPVEAVNGAPFARALDAVAGIDFWQWIPHDIAGAVITGIAARRQIGPAYDTFTIRRSIRSGRPTEYAKRLTALSCDGILHPYLTIQAYMDTARNLLSVGVAETRAVLEAVDIDDYRTNWADDSTFYVVAFDDVRGCARYRPGVLL